MSKITKIILHSADTPADMDIGAAEINQSLVAGLSYFPVAAHHRTHGKG